MALRIEPFDGAIGAAVIDIDLAQPLDAEERERLIEAWNRYSVLVFRDQQIAPDEFLRYSRYFGDLEVHVLEQYLHPVHPEILVVSNILEYGRNIGIPDAGRYWHTDLSYLDVPSRGSILYAMEIPEAGGETLGNTLWASTAAAYEALPEATRARVDGLQAEYSLSKRFQKLADDGTKHIELSDEQREKTPSVTHPVVRTHPETGRKGLYVNPGMTVRLEGFEADESEALLGFLFGHATQHQFIYRHRWRQGDVVIWDNRSLMHCAVCNYGDQPRYMERTTGIGDQPV